MPINPALDPLWFPWRFDEIADGFQVRHLTRDDHAGATFLTDEYLGIGPVQLVARNTLPSLAQAPLHFIFHSAFCLSTVLARAFNLPGLSMGLKEPMVLNDMAGLQLRGVGGASLASTLGSSLALLARPFSPGESVVIKPSNIANVLIAGMMQLRPQSRAVLVHAPLRVYLGSICRKGLDGRLWVRDLLIKQHSQGLHDFGFGLHDYFAQSDLQVAAMGWLAQHRLFGRLASRLTDRIRTLNSDLITAEPAAVITALGQLFDIDLDAAAVVTGPAFTRHSKHGVAFDAAARERERTAEAIYSDEIDKVVIWTERVAESQDIPLILPNPLIS